MKPPTAKTAFDALEATWPPANRQRRNGFTTREGQGGGKRVSATTCVGTATAQGVEKAEEDMLATGQTPLFMVRDGDCILDQLLEGRGYLKLDPTTLYLARTNELCENTPPGQNFRAWPPLAVAKEIWEAGNIGPARIAVMERSKGPKTTVLTRLKERPVGVAFVACHHGIAMLHALEVSERFRRQGAARQIVKCAANWAADADADWFGVAVTEANTAANALYQGLGMRPITRYHYRCANADGL